MHRGCCAFWRKQAYELREDIRQSTGEEADITCKKRVSLDQGKLQTIPFTLVLLNTDSENKRNIGGSEISKEAYFHESSNTESEKQLQLGVSNKNNDSGIEGNTDSENKRNLGGSEISKEAYFNESSNNQSEKQLQLGESKDSKDSGFNENKRNLGGSEISKEAYFHESSNTESEKQLQLGVSNKNNDSGFNENKRNLGGSEISKEAFFNESSNTESEKQLQLGVSNKSNDSGIEENKRNLGGSEISKEAFFNEPANTASQNNTNLSVSKDSINIGLRDTQEYLQWLSEKDKKKLQRNYQYLRENLTTLPVTRILVAQGVFTDSDETEIKDKLLEEAKAELFMQKLVHSKPESYEIFLNALRDSKLEFIVDKLESPSWRSHVEISEDLSEFRRERIEKMLNENTAYIVKELHLKNIMPYFVVHEIIKIEDIGDIVCMPRTYQARVLLKHILRNLPQAYDVLLYSLQQTGSERLAHKLNAWVSETRSDTTDKEGSMLQRNGRNSSNTAAPVFDIELRIKFGQTENEHILMEYLRDHLNAHKQDELGKQLLQKTGCVFNKAVLGSLVLYLTPCSRESYTKLLEFCKDGRVEDLLKTLLSTDRAKQLLPKGRVSIKIQLLAKSILEESKNKDVRCLRSKLIEVFETAVDEIDPIDFKDSFIKQDLLSEEYFHQLDIDLGHSRSARATDFLTKVLQLGDNAILAFKETVEKKGPEYLLEVLYRDSKREHDNHDHDECIAELGLLKKTSHVADGFVFYDRDFSLTIQDSIDLEEIKILDGEECRRKPGTNVQMTTSAHEHYHISRQTDNLCPESPISSTRNSSGYCSLGSSVRSNEYQLPFLVEHDSDISLTGCQMPENGFTTANLDHFPLTNLPVYSKQNTIHEPLHSYFMF